MAQMDGQWHPPRNSLPRRVRPFSAHLPSNYRAPIRRAAVFIKQAITRPIFIIPHSWFIILPLLLSLTLIAEERDTDWPPPPRNARPGLQWHWPENLPSAEQQLTELERIAKAGFGGVEIRPSPASPLGPDSSLEWLAPGWIERLSQTSKQAERLGLTLDFSCINGSHPGGPWLPPEAAATTLSPVISQTKGGPLALELPPGSISALGAWPLNGAPTDLLPWVNPESHTLNWDAPPGSWRIYGAISLQPAATIAGASPGGAGSVLDPFSPAAIAPWIGHIDAAFTLFDAPAPRSRSLDVTDVEAANWTPNFFPAAQHRRGYDLREILPTMFGNDETGTVDRVQCDYRETLADLHRETLLSWHRSTHQQGSLSMLRIRGSTGNPIDLHSIADIPGTVAPGLPGPEIIPQLLFASSAAHLTTKPLVTATAFAKTADPSSISPTQMKEVVDLLWLGGINHLSLDGLRSLPADSPPFEGTHFTPLGPGSGRWDALPAFNAYITRCQSILQSGAPAPDVLLYYPAHDFWSERNGIPSEPEARAKWLRLTAFHRCATSFYENGVSFDYVSDRLLSSIDVINGRIILGGLGYQTLVLPKVRRLPETTAQRLLELTRRGARIAILDDWPQDVPGFPMPDIRRGTLFSSLQDIPDAAAAVDSNPIALVKKLGVTPEPMAAHGLRFVRRSHAEGHHYFIVNRSGKKIDLWTPLATPAKSAVLMDPRFHRRNGLAPTRSVDGQLQIHLVLEAGESRILRSFANKSATGPIWPEHTPAAATAISGNWKIDFLHGFPELPESYESPILGSWTTLADPRATHFAGTARYQIEFDLPESSSGKWLLDLGQIADTAQVLINGNDAGTAFAPPHQFDISRLLKPGQNTLVVKVSNLAANRLHPERPPLPSGLLGPVRLILLAE